MNPRDNARDVGPDGDIPGAGLHDAGAGNPVGEFHSGRLRHRLRVDDRFRALTHHPQREEETDHGEQGNQVFSDHKAS